MKTVELTSKEFATIPGYTTKKTPAYWRGKIDTLLYELEDLPNVTIERQAWLRQKGTPMQTLLLEMTLQIGNLERSIQFQMEPVLIRRQVRKGRSRGLSKVIEEKNASWKLFHDLLERKLAGARLGLVEIQHEFMPYISKQLPDGSVGTFADFMDMVLENQKGLEGLQLEDRRDPKIIEVEVNNV